MFKWAPPVGGMDGVVKSPITIAKTIAKCYKQSKDKIAFNCYIKGEIEDHAITITIHPKYDNIGIWDHNGPDWQYDDSFPTTKVAIELDKLDIPWQNLNPKEEPMFGTTNICLKYTTAKLKELTQGS